LKLIEGEAPVLSKLNVFQMAFAMASHAGKRQALISQNIANADTPGYKARDLVPFSSHFADMQPDQSESMLSRRASHLHGVSGPTGKWREIDATAAFDPSENNVSIELEMLRAVEAKRQHDRALAIYKSSLTVLRTSLGRS
jgi:flagellar basal-body rod protein FlgB